MLARLVKVLAAAVLVSTSALVCAQTQSKRSQPIRAGIVILDSARVGTGPAISAAPYAWFNLQSDKIVKPASWNIYNPNAPSMLTQEIRDRWVLIDPATPATGARLSKRQGAYWEVILSQLSDSAIANYDVLLVNPANYAALNPQEREKLRKFVDKGGLLWIDTGALKKLNLGQDLINNFPIAFQTDVAGGNVERYDATQPLLSNPNPLSTDEVALLNGSLDPGFSFPFALYPAAASGLDNIVGGVTQQFFKLQPVVTVQDRPTVSVGQIGDGLVVVTTRGASMKLNRPFGFTTTDNTKYSGLDPVLDRDGVTAAKLAVNMISMLGEFRQQNGGSRRSSGSAIDLGPPLLRKTTVPAGVASAPTIYKGMAFAVVGNRLVAYDTDPYHDLDGDGNPDDGLPDLVTGVDRDVVWQSTAIFSGQASTPVCAEIPDANGAPVDQVLVVDGNGQIQIFNASPKANGIFDQTPGKEWPPFRSLSIPSGASAAASPLAPTVHEGLAYITDSATNGANVRGRISVIDLSTDKFMSSTNGPLGVWSIGGSASPVQIPNPTAGATVGYIPIQDNSGGSDKVLYLPFESSAAGVPSAGVISIWLGARGERPTDYEPKAGNTANALVVTTRASQQGGLPIYIPTNPSPLGVKLALIDKDGNVMTANGRPGFFANKGMTDIFGANPIPTDLGGGVLSFAFAPGVTSLPGDVTGIRLDYSIDLGTTSPGVLAAIERGRINLPDRPGVGTRRIQGAVALSPSGNFFVSIQSVLPGPNGDNRGGVYGIREEGRGLFKMVMRYEMYGDHSITLNGGSQVSYGGTFFDDDPFRLFIAERTNNAIKFGGQLTRFRIVGSPAIRNGQVFVTALAREPLNIFPAGVPVTVLMSFKADPEVAQVHVGDLPDGSTILQPDVARSINSSSPETPSVLAGANYSYDPNSGYVRFENLATTQKGVVQNSISLSQPIIVRRPGQPDQFIEPDAVGGSKWSPLLWYSVLAGLDCSSSAGPLAAGDTVYVAGSSMTPSILSGKGFKTVGMIYALRTDVSPGNPFLTGTDSNVDQGARQGMQKLWPPQPPTRPWMNQFNQLRLTASDMSNPGSSQFEANSGFLWPLLRGIQSAEQYLVRLNQTTLTGNGADSTVARGVVGGNGALVSWGDNGLYTFTRSDFLVADEGRVASFSPSGELLWSSSAFGSSGDTGPAASGSVRPVVKPTRAFRLANGQILAVDTGSNRIVQFDTNGIETRSISKILLDNNVVPSGFTQNETLTLNKPRDVLTYSTYVSRPNLDSLVTPGDGEGAGATEYWVHYLIADAGNHRLIELIDRYAFDTARLNVGLPIRVNGVPQYGVLLWHSPTDVSGKQYAYNSISRVWLPSSPTTGRYVYVAGVGGDLPTKVDSGLDPSGGGSGTRTSRSGNGGIVIFDPQDPKGMLVFNKLSLPAFDTNVFWNEGTSSFNSASRPAGLITLSNVASVTARLVPNSSVIAIMVADSSGVYEATYDGSPNPGESIPVQWMIPSEAYRVMRRDPFTGLPSSDNAALVPTYARRLDNGDVLIVNGYFGPLRDPSKKIGGEIVQLDGSLNAAGTVTAPNLGFSPLSIRFELPPIDGSRGLVLPVFADRR